VHRRSTKLEHHPDSRLFPTAAFDDGGHLLSSISGCFQPPPPPPLGTSPGFAGRGHDLATSADYHAGTSTNLSEWYTISCPGTSGLRRVVTAQY